MRLREWLAAAVLLTSWANAPAADVVVEGTALIRHGDVAQAREQAVRRALARAVESKEVRVSAQTTVLPGAALEAVQVRATACTEDSQQLGERRQGDELTVTLRVRVAENGNCRRDVASTCRPSYTNRIVVTGFAMEYPEQKLAEERSGLSRLTAIETTKKIVRRGRLLAEFEENVFPYRSPAHAPDPLMYRSDSETPFAAVARKQRGQYVLSGVYRDFGLSTSNPWWPRQSRRIEIEAFLHDGANGEVLARERFTTEAVGNVSLAAKPEIGSGAFYRTDLGRTWGELLDRLAAWAEEEAACLPFLARVLNTEGSQIYIDAGAESGLAAGDSLNLHNWREPPVQSATGLALGREKRPGANATIRHVYPKFSVLELTDAPQRIDIRKGDVLYAR